MPQMSPLMWLYLMFMFLFGFLLFFLLVYFMAVPQLVSSAGGSKMVSDKNWSW